MIGIILAFQRTNDDYLQVQKVVNDISVSLECPCLRRFDIFWILVTVKNQANVLTKEKDSTTYKVGGGCFI